MLDKIVEVDKAKNEAIEILKLLDKTFQSILSNPYIYYFAMSDNNLRDLIIRMNKIHEVVKKLNI